MEWVGYHPRKVLFPQCFFLIDSHFNVWLDNIGTMRDHDGKEQRLYVMLIKMF